MAPKHESIFPNHQQEHFANKQCHSQHAGAKVIAKLGEHHQMFARKLPRP